MTSCNHRWTESNTDTITAVFAVLVVFVILVLVGSFFMWRRVRALKLDPKQYGHTSASTDGVEVRPIRSSCTVMKLGDRVEIAVVVLTWHFLLLCGLLLFSCSVL